LAAANRIAVLVEHVRFQNRQGAPDDLHVIPQGADVGRQDLLAAPHLVEDVADYGGEQARADAASVTFPSVDPCCFGN
jgi:hypothetical protein